MRLGIKRLWVGRTLYERGDVIDESHQDEVDERFAYAVDKDSSFDEPEEDSPEDEPQGGGV